MALRVFNALTCGHIVFRFVPSMDNKMVGANANFAALLIHRGNNNTSPLSHYRHNRQQLQCRRWLSSHAILRPRPIIINGVNQLLQSDQQRPTRQKKRSGRRKKRTWMENYEALLEFKRLHQHCRVPKLYCRDTRLGRWVSEQRTGARESLSLNQLKLLNAAGFDWETKDERKNRVWQEQYHKLIGYKEKHGNFCIPLRNKSDTAFGYWVSVQRKLRKQGELRKDRQRQLDAIGFTWTVREASGSANNRRWNAKYQRLIEFRDTWGHCVAPNRFEDDPVLARWVYKQRTFFHKHLLRPDRKRLLDEIGFVFDFSNTMDQRPLDRRWNTLYQHLVDYKSKNGHTDVPSRFWENGLGNWVTSQRRKKDSLCEWKRKQLDAIGFSWSRLRDNLHLRRWQKRFEELCEYRKLQGTSKVKKKENPILSRWVYRQRSRIKKGTISLEELKKLESIGFE